MWTFCTGSFPYLGLYAPMYWTLWLYLHVAWSALFELVWFFGLLDTAQTHDLYQNWLNCFVLFGQFGLFLFSLFDLLCFGLFGLVGLVWSVWFGLVWFGQFGLVGLIWFGQFGLVGKVWIFGYLDNWIFGYWDFGIGWTGWIGWIGWNCWNWKILKVVFASVRSGPTNNNRKMPICWPLPSFQDWAVGKIVTHL